MYADKIACINLFDESRTTFLKTSEYANKYIGGRGINARLLYDYAEPGGDALGRGNPLIFGAGALGGLRGPRAEGGYAPFARTEVTAKSPETGYLGSSNFGGAFAIEMKRAGFDHLMFLDRAKMPVYTVIENGKIKILSADWLWGKDVTETQAALKEKYGDNAQIACIGQAGENQVRFAAIRHGRPHVAGRTGLGCVMGAKNLKAIVAIGSSDVEIDNAEQFAGVVERSFHFMEQTWWHQEITEHGHPRMIDRFPHFWDDMGGSHRPIARMLKEHKPKKTGCVGCPTPCYQVYEDHEGGTAMNCAYYIWPSLIVKNDDTEVLLDAVSRLHRYGMDAVSCLAVIRMLMEMQDAGVIESEETDGIEMKWGDKGAILGMIDKIAFRNGIGDVLANGMRAVAEHFGERSEPYALHVKGLPLYGFFNRDIWVNDKTAALNLVISSRGDTMRAHFPGVIESRLKEVYETDGAKAYANAIHQDPEKVDYSPEAFDAHKYEGKAERSAISEDAITMNDLIGFCKLQNWHLGKDEKEELHADFLTAATGRKFSVDDVYFYARKVANLERAYNVREGMTRETDRLPKGLMKHVIKDGQYEGAHLDEYRFERLKGEFYRIRGWDEDTGIPTRSTLEQFELFDVARDLENRNLLPLVQDAV